LATLKLSRSGDELTSDCLPVTTILPGSPCAGAGGAVCAKADVEPSKAAEARKRNLAEIISNTLWKMHAPSLRHAIAGGMSKQ
jgi:hypothetical protein